MSMHLWHPSLPLWPKHSSPRQPCPLTCLLFLQSAGLQGVPQALLELTTLTRLELMCNQLSSIEGGPYLGRLQVRALSAAACVPFLQHDRTASTHEMGLGSVGECCTCGKGSLPGAPGNDCWLVRWSLSQPGAAPSLSRCNALCACVYVLLGSVLRHQCPQQVVSACC